jgi:hypothetical protein
MKWLMAQKLEHREQRIPFEELLEGIRQESERVERLENAIREASSSMTYCSSRPPRSGTVARCRLSKRKST